MLSQSPKRLKMELSLIMIYKTLPFLTMTLLICTNIPIQVYTIKKMSTTAKMKTTMNKIKIAWKLKNKKKEIQKVQPIFSSLTLIYLSSKRKPKQRK